MSHTAENIGPLKKIYIVRHGETDFNKQGIVQGSGIDAPLNELGHKQALQFYKFYNHIPFDCIYTSSLLRTHQTAKHFIAQNIPWRQHSGLNEINWGSREGKKPDKIDNLLFNEIVTLWNQGHSHIAFDGGESPTQVANRQAEFLDILLAQKNEQNVLVAMHGRALKILLAKIIDNDLSKMDNYEHSNLCLYIVEYNYVNNKFDLILANDIGHLKINP